jgi:hypothetical protein
MATVATVGASPRNGEVIVGARDGLRQIRRVGGILGEYARLAGRSDEESVAALEVLLREYRGELWDERGAALAFPAEYEAFYAVHTKAKWFEEWLMQAPEPGRVMSSLEAFLMQAPHAGPRPEGFAEADAWGMAFLELWRALQDSIKESTDVFMVGDWDDTEDVDRFWAAVPAMQLKFAEVLRYVYDWETKIAASKVKSMVQESMQWCELCQCCVAVLQRRGGGGQAFVDLYAEFMTARGKLEGELQGVGLQIALFKDGKQSTLPSSVGEPRPVPGGAKKVAGGGSNAQMVHMRGLLAGMGELHGLSGSNELRHLGAVHKALV